MKTCRKCNESKELDMFYKSPGMADGYRSDCMRCHKDYAKAYRLTERYKDTKRKYEATDKAKLAKRKHSLKYNYGISLDSYNTMYKSQDGKCEICSKKENKLNVDHDHETGEVRGLLCNNCNTGIGLLKDSQDILFQSQVYLLKDVDVVGGLNNE